jgi:glycosyltransferase involved in cell wall biosynthesis
VLDYSNRIRRKVLLVTPAMPWGAFGGTATVSRNIVQLFSEVLDVHVCYLRSDKPSQFRPQQNEVTVLSERISGFQRRIKALVDFRYDSFAHRQFQRKKVVGRFRGLLEEQRPEFIIFDHIYSSWLIDTVQDQHSKVAYIAHDDMVAYAESLISMTPGLFTKLRFNRLRSQYRRLQDKVLRRCDFVLTLTEHDALLLKSACARTETEVFPIYFEMPKYSKVYSCGFDSLLVTGSFDTWEKQRGLSVFIERIFMPLVQKSPDIRLVIAGRFAQAFKKRLPLIPQLRVMESPSETVMRELFRKASAAAVLDLQKSGLKIKTIELAAAGLPLVSWAPGLDGTNLVNGRSCLLACSTSDFITHLGRLFEEPNLRRALGLEARATVEAEFSEKTARARFKKLKFFDALAAARAVRSASL